MSVHLLDPIAASAVQDDAPAVQEAVFPAPAAARWYLVTKRLVDVVVAVVLLVALSPLLLAVALLVRVGTPGPAFFRQERCGKDGTPFVCYKFRTMVDGADAMKAALVHLNEHHGPAFKARNDPRITPAGRWLRKLSIDELPQLLNVIKGEMSLVGPRPPLPSEVAQYTPYQRQRLAVVPGLTCIWQVSGRSAIDFDRWVELDLEYIRRRSLWLDLWLVLRTIPAVLFARGAM